MHDFNLAQWMAMLAGVGILLFDLGVVLNLVLCGLFPSIIRAGSEGGPQEFEQFAEDAGARLTVFQLQELGFKPLGIKVEYMPLWGRVRELAMASADARAFASIGILFGKVRTFYYYTTFADGGLVLTAQKGFPRTTAAGCVIGSHPGTGANELLEIHQSCVDNCVEEGQVINDDYSMGGRVEATYHYYAAGPARKQSRNVGLGILGFFIFLAFVGIRLVMSGLTGDFTWIGRFFGAW